MSDAGSTESPRSEGVGSAGAGAGSDPRTSMVGAGYDAMADTWEEWSERVTGDPRLEWLARLVELLPDGATVVELGCGNGTAETRDLAARFRLTSVDLSAEQLRRARARVPGVPMYFSGHEPERNRDLLAPFEQLEDEVVTITEPEGTVAFHWILDRR